jgi:uncharacterized RDD family membrane protein YckC
VDKHINDRDYGTTFTDIDMENSFRYAGFWRRFIAVIIDYVIVSVLVLPLAVIIDTLAPGSIVLQVPFDALTAERVISTKSTEEKNSDGSTTVVEARRIEVTVLGKWTYLYSERIKHFAGKTEKTRRLLDPKTETELRETQSSNIAILVLIVYWSLMESSRFQASIGKRALGIRVVDEHGRRLTTLRALGRNASKVFSVITLMVGFAMAGWTKNKQALHDIIARCYVILADNGDTKA